MQICPIPPRLLGPALLVAGTLTAGCRQEPGSEYNVAQNPVVNLPSVPRPDPPLDRATLLAAVAQAASATAAGTDASAELRPLDGRQFEIRIRFGCRGPAPDLREAWLGWSFDPESRTVRLRAKPTIATEEPLLAKLGEAEFEAVEGFWIPRPWLLQPVCPANAAIKSAAPEGASAGDKSAEQEVAAEDARADVTEPVPAWPRVGLVQYFTSRDARTGRRDNRPYEAVHTLAEGKAMGSQGFNLVLAGRLRALPGRKVIECSATNADSPPECIVSAEFDRVRIEQPESGEVIAEWGSG